MVSLLIKAVLAFVNAHKDTQDQDVKTEIHASLTPV
jgi:hypothetical protein